MVTTIIPARGGSKSIPKKNIIPFLGNPLITYSIYQSVNSSAINHTYVSTDHKHIAEISKNAGARIIDRPDELASDTASTEEVLLHGLKSIDSPDDIIVLIQCTSPLRRKEDIAEAVRLVNQKGYDSVLTCCKDHSFYWELQDDSAVPINYDPKKRKRRQDLEQRYQENGSIYVMKREVLEEHHCRLGGEIGIHEMPKEMSFEIDTPKDYHIVESIGEQIEFYGKDQSYD